MEPPTDGSGARGEEGDGRSTRRVPGAPPRTSLWHAPCRAPQPNGHWAGAGRHKALRVAARRPRAPPGHRLRFADRSLRRALPSNKLDGTAVVVRCARRAVAEWPVNGSRDRAAARVSGARELRSSTRRRRGREPRQAVLQRRRRPCRRGAEALALPRRPGGRAAAVLAPSSLCSSLHARRLVAPAREPRQRPWTREPPSSPRKGRPSASSPLRGSGRRPRELICEAMTSPRRSSRAATTATTIRRPGRET